MVTWGRFINADDTDTLDNSGELLSNNLFSYCNNNHVNMEDPDGDTAVVLEGGHNWNCNLSGYWNCYRSSNWYWHNRSCCNYSE